KRECRKEEKEGRRTPREPGAVQKRGEGSKKSAARAERGAEKGERKQEERRASLARCRKEGEEARRAPPL
ncbi:hypothetical protein Q75_16600, partial [Bacillus coahuilensis p1.1.43]